MPTTLQQVAASSGAQGNTPACNKCKRKVVDNTEAEQSCSSSRSTSNERKFGD